MSILPFVNPQRKKDELNRQFQKSHPKISKKITLSQIRTLKMKLIEIFLQCEEPYIDVYTVAYAWVLFEKLIYKGIVKKHNRKLLAALCVLIAFKCTEAYGGFEQVQDRFLKLQ